MDVAGGEYRRATDAPGIQPKRMFPGSGTAAGVKVFYSFELLSGRCKGLGGGCIAKTYKQLNLNIMALEIEKKSLTEEKENWLSNEFWPTPKRLEKDDSALKLKE